MKAKLKPSKTHHGPQTWKRISSPPMFRRARILIYSLHKKGGRLKEKELEQSILEPPVFSSICICMMLQCMRESRKLWFDAVKTDSTFTQILNQTVHLASPTLSLRWNCLSPRTL